MKLTSIKYDRSVNNEELAIKAKEGCEYSKELLLTNNIPLVTRLAKRWKRAHGSASELDDLISLGCLGLMNCYNYYDTSKNIKFSTFLGKLVWQQYIGMTINNKREKRDSNKYITVSIDAPPKDEEGYGLHETLHDETGSKDYISSEEAVYGCQLIKIITDSGLLNVRELEIIKEHFIGGFSFSDLARKRNVSRQAIQQTFRNCMARLNDNNILLKYMSYN